MELFYTDINDCSKFSLYLIDFKASQINQCTINDEIPVVETTDFEKIVTSNLFENTEFTFGDYNGVVCIVNSKMNNRKLYTEVENGMIQSVYLTRDQIETLDQLLEFEDYKDNIIFQSIANALEQHIPKILEYSKSEKAIFSYAKNYYSDECFYEELTSFLNEEVANEVYKCTKNIEKIVYNNFDFDELTNNYIMNEQVHEEQDLEL